MLIGSILQSMALALGAWLLEPVVGWRVAVAIMVIGWAVMPYPPAK